MKTRKILEYIQNSSLSQQDIGFVCRLMIITVLPYTKVRKDTYHRHLQNNELFITNGVTEIIPYGVYPRLILTWIISEAVRTKSKVIEIGSGISSIMKQLGIPISGGKNGSFNRFKTQFLSLLTSHFTYSTFDYRRNKKIVLSFQIADAMKYTEDNELTDTKIVLNDNFFQEVIRAPIPVDNKALNTLTHSPLALDIYFWLTYKMSFLRTATEIPFSALKEQFGAGYNDTKCGKYEFKRKFIPQLKAVLAVYDKANVKIHNDHIVISPSLTHVAKQRIKNQPY